jgi:hypothetical protein
LLQRLAEVGRALAQVSLSRRVFSMAITAWAAKFGRTDLLSVNRGHLPAVERYGSDQIALFEHRHGNQSSGAT